MDTISFLGLFDFELFISEAGTDLVLEGLAVLEGLGYFCDLGSVGFDLGFFVGDLVEDADVGL